ncbi:hypothetical protein A8C75_20060 [Marinobacterium aestuarii]|uniref:Type II secretion system protein GspF domain-containing protein n=1 Tax=Marinobacterium aestuarii TaxID=1821621 RepID=A0A1A9F3T5_9GAMM|nr:type II secretion system F family protein [Marinobacterium aestuarii]ANG64538.1 hypothetical protein A8C75_20060 [Marinobacterium aestuarii]
MLIGISVGLLLAAGLLLLLASRTGSEAPPAPAPRERPSRLSMLGSNRSLLMLAVLIVAGVGLSYHMGGAYFAVVAAAVLPALAMLLVLYRRSVLQQHQRRQLPGFINQIVRRVTVGANLSQAVERAAKSIESPLADVLQRALHRTQLGDELAAAFHFEARRTGLNELALLATVFNINHQYGGSVVTALDSLAKLLLQRERAWRELRAMTGETRFTALVFGAVPALMALYLLLVSPAYLLGMWHDEGGRQLLLAGAGLQMLGVLVLWRMIKSI